jgi:hypothetical protein
MLVDSSVKAIANGIHYSYKLAAIKLMTASQEHLEKHCKFIRVHF